MIERITESTSNHDELEQKSTLELLTGMNQEDKSVPLAVEKILSNIESFVDACYERMKNGGRLFYLGAGTSGRLGIVDASECPPTFGVEHGIVVGLMAGGDKAMRKAVEFAEDDLEQGWLDLAEYAINGNDTLIGIAASGTTPYVLAAMKKANEHGVLTGSISCNPHSPLEQLAQYPMTAVVGPEFVTGSTRMKSGTAQKLILNMISTALMIKLGRVQGNRMVDMQLSNNKLVDRGAKMIQAELKNSYEEAADLLKRHGSVRKAIESQTK
jgi:N-acetylmuramic acid 6-phosphate etherase